MTDRITADLVRRLGEAEDRIETLEAAARIAARRPTSMFPGVAWEPGGRLLEAHQLVAGLDVESPHLSGVWEIMRAELRPGVVKLSRLQPQLDTPPVVIHVDSRTIELHEARF